MFEQIYFETVNTPELGPLWVVCLHGCKPVLVTETELTDYDLFRVAFTKANDFILPGKRKAKREWREFIRYATQTADDIPF